MQVAIWVILLATVGLAEVVSSARRASRVELATQSIAVKTVSVRLPANK